MKILNTEVEFNFNDADDMEKLEKAEDRHPLHCLVLRYIDVF